jgi:hypothetical protein
MRSISGRSGRRRRKRSPLFHNGDLAYVRWFDRATAMTTTSRRQRRSIGRFSSQIRFGVMRKCNQ